jgi:RHS repeat-associated protein
MLGAELGERLSERLRYDLCDNVVGIARRSPDDEGGEREEVCGYGPGNLLERRGEVVHRYDEAGQVVERVDGDGRRTRYLWDGAGRLVQAILPDRSEWRYSYDAFGRRVSKDGPTEVVEFVWDGDVVLHEIHRPRAQTKPGRRQWPPPMPEPPRVIDWEYEPESFAPIGKRDGDSSYLCVNDPAGNPRELVSDEGEVVWRALYSAFGELVAEERGNGVGCPVRLQGQWHDEETGLSYNRFRYYDPAFGRFISPDPLRVFGGVNLYSYGANTTGWTDPFGLTVTAGEAGAFGALDRRAVSHDKLTPHHMPQDALGFLPRSEGGAIVLPHAEHVLTRTYGGKGGATKKADAGLSFRDVLAKDLRDLRRIAGGKYDQGIRDLLRYYRKNHPQMMKRKQGKCPRT